MEIYLFHVRMTSSFLPPHHSAENNVASQQQQTSNNHHDVVDVGEGDDISDGGPPRDQYHKTLRP